MAIVGDQITESDNDRKARLALCAILGVAGAFVLSGEIGTDMAAFRRSVVTWIAYCILAGITVNSPKGEKIGFLLIGSLASTVLLIVTLLFSLVFGREFCLSGKCFAFSEVKTNSGELGFMLGFLAIVSLATMVGIIVAAYARPLILSLLLKFWDPTISSKIEKTLNRTIKILTSIGVIAGIIYNIK